MSASFLEMLTPQSTLAELPSWDVRVAGTMLGSEVDGLLRSNPTLPGVIVTDGTLVRGAVSRAQFQQTISRPFGRDVVGPRAIRLLLDEVSPGEPEVLEAVTPVQTAVRRALSRPAALLYEPLLVRHNQTPSAVSLVAFPDLLQADSRISFLRNLQMQEILATVQEGFLLLERDHRIAAEYSRSAEAILGRSELAGIDLPALLGELAGHHLADLTRGYLETLFNPNVIEKLVGDLNPLRAVEFPARDGKARQHLRFGFRRSIEGKQIRRILVRIEDRTREVELASEVEQQERQAALRVELAMQMVQADPEALTDYLTRYLAEIAQLGRVAGAPGDRSARDAIHLTFRILHGLKGEAGVIGLRSFAERLHRVEDTVERLRTRAELTASDLAVLITPIDSLRTLGDEAKELVARLGALAKTASFTRREAVGLIPTLQSSIADLSHRLAKPATLVLHDGATELPAEYAGLVRDVLIQLTRNALVHGIETAQERKRAAKPLPATVQLAIRRHESERQLEIVFQDDGRGLDLARIRQRGRELFGRDFNDSEAAQLIFEPGFSTASETTTDAGRGVGLDLVREKIESAGGVILVHSEPGAFCAFQIVLPLANLGQQEAIA